MHFILGDCNFRICVDLNVILRTFERLRHEVPVKDDYARDVYKPLWRGSSVLSLANRMTERRSLSEGRGGVASRERSLLTRGVGSRIWSSLSLEQVNILRNQLNEIYGADHSQKQQLSENEKKQLSQSISTDVRNHFLRKQQQRYKTSVSLVLGKETRGAVAAIEAQSEIESPRTCYSLELSDDGRSSNKNKDNEFVLVLARNDSQENDIKATLKRWAQPKPALLRTDAISPPKSETTTESGSNTDESSRTVIERGKDDVRKKVRYFEETAKAKTYIPTVHKAANNNSEENLSQSQQDLTQFFGESELARFAINERNCVFRSRSLSPYFGEAHSLVRAGLYGFKENDDSAWAFWT